ncbi:MAG TPA: hypothetical protein VF765_07610 [Polyangiaceae bacterium]
MRLLGAAARATGALLLAAGGCTFLAPLGGLEGSGGGGDAAAETLDEVAPEAMGDGAAEGASDASDAAADSATHAEAEADAPPAPFCTSLSPQPALCADFDEGAFNTGFPVLSEPASGDVGSDGQYSVSAPNSLYAKIAQGDAIANTFAYVERTFTSSAKGADFAFDIRPVSITANASAVTAKIGLDLGLPTEHTLGLVLSTTDRIEESFFESDGGEVFLEHDFAGAVMQVGQWTRIDIVLSLAQGTVEVLADGVQVLAPSALDASWPTSTSTLTVDVGFLYANSTSSAWTARYDDVVVSLM